MDLNLNPNDLAFRDDVRAFLDENLTDDIREGARLTPSVRSPLAPSRAWGKTLAKKGWLCHAWPQEYGGPGWSPVQRYIFESECALAGTPVLNHMGRKMVGPVVMKYGSQAQKDEDLPGILNDDLLWCQGYSEPGAGSDLASLQTSAVSDGDDYIINGSKIWTTGAHQADHIFCLVRTSSDGKSQEGISFVLFRMDTPGITVKPILTFAGDHDFNQVFLDDVRVPKANRVGEENKGWTVAKYLLEFERGGVAYSPQVKASAQKLAEIARQAPVGGGAKLVDDPDFRRKMSSLEIQVTALEMSERRVMGALSQGQNPGPASSIFKLRGSEVYQAVLEAAVKAIAYYANPYQPEAYVPGNNVETIAPDEAVTASSLYFNQRAATIYAGSSEVQRTIIAKHVLGL